MLSTDVCRTVILLVALISHFTDSEDSEDVSAPDKLSLDVTASEANTFGKLKVAPPDSFVPNCPRCKAPEVPAGCSYIPPRSIPSQRVIDDVELGRAPPALTRRKLLAARPGRPRPRARGKPVAKKTRRTHQPAFDPPSATAREILVEVLRRWKAAASLSCGIWTLDCARNFVIHNNTAEIPGLGAARRNPLMNIFQDKKLPSNWESLFPDIKAPGGLGTCAVVAVGDNMLDSNRGSEIDAHDTVFRYNSPIRKYARAVGSKSDIIYWKVRGDEKEYGVENQQASRFYMWKEPRKFWMFGSKADWQTNSYRGKPLIWPTGSRGQEAYGAAYEQYKTENKIERGAPSGGNKLAMDVISSNLCSRVDLYGYTARGSAKYFNKGKTMSLVHILGLEHWMYRTAMEEGGVCVYS